MEGKVLKRGVHFVVNGVYHSFFFIVILFVFVVGIVLFSDQILLLEKLRMYSLVQFVEDIILYVTPSKGITPIEGKLVWAPYKRMGYYEANIICTNSNKLVLTEVMRKMKKGQVKRFLEEKESNAQMLKVSRSTRENHKNNCGKEFDNIQKYQINKDNCAEYSGGGNFQKTFVENVLSNDNIKTNSVSENVLNSNSEAISHVKEPLEKNKSNEQFLKVTISTTESHKINCGKKLENVLKYKNIKDNFTEHSAGGNIQKTLVENTLSNGNTKTNSVSGNVSSSSSEVISHGKRPKYSTPEKELLQSSMEYHSLEGSEPSLQELEELKSKHDIFQHRSAESLFKKYKEIRQKQSNSISNNTFD